MTLRIRQFVGLALMRAADLFDTAADRIGVRSMPAHGVWSLGRRIAGFGYYG